MNIYNTLFILLLLSMASCKPEGRETKESVPGETVPSNTFSVAEGWDIYGGGGFRYGPSIIQNPDRSVDVWFASPGNYHGKKTMHYQDGVQYAVSLTDGATAAQK